MSDAGIASEETVMFVLRALRKSSLFHSFRHIDCGAYAHVVEAVCCRTSKPVALKVFKVHFDSVCMQATSLREVRATSNVHHPSVLALERSLLVSSKFLVLQMPRYDCSLAQYKRRGGLAHANRAAMSAFIFKRVAEGIAAAHGVGIMHRDLKPGNVLLRTGSAECADVVIADWGMSRDADDTAPDMLSSEVITTWYAPPEVLLGRVYGPSADMWSLGVLLFELSLGRNVFRGGEVRARFVTEINTMQLRLKEHVDGEVRCPHLANLLRGLLSVNPEDRPTAAAVLENAYVQAATPQALPFMRSKSTQLLLGLLEDERSQTVHECVPARQQALPFRPGWPPVSRPKCRLALLRLVSAKYSRWFMPYVQAMHVCWVSGCDVTPARMFACYTLASACMQALDDLVYRDRASVPYYDGTRLNTFYDVVELESHLFQLLHGHLPLLPAQLRPFAATRARHHSAVALMLTFPDVVMAQWNLSVADVAAMGSADDDLPAHVREWERSTWETGRP